MSIRQQRLSICKHKCEMCGSYKKDLHMHHVFGGSGRRKAVESVETVRMLCVDCHRDIHNNESKANEIRAKICKGFIMEYGEDEARKMVGGRLYFVDEPVRTKALDPRILDLQTIIQKTKNLLAALNPNAVIERMGFEEFLDKKEKELKKLMEGRKCT